GVNYVLVHPTFLYESAWNFCLLILLLIYRKHKRFDGEITLFYLAGYGIGRFFIEGLRTDQLLIPYLNVPISQVIGITAFVVCVTMDIVVRFHVRHEEEYLGESRSLADNQKLGRD
ncbi:MAG: prolipoprotein diacylglyceryl transferase, partial [Lachnospiraceae bacterium]|nr:prolipoprotein diacylglyceryl transferase [Lachnospiraceae bacterium]